MSLFYFPQPWIKDVIDGFMASFSDVTRLWCDTDLACDVTTEGGEITGYSSASKTGGIFALLFGLFAALVRF